MNKKLLKKSSNEVSSGFSLPLISQEKRANKEIFPLPSNYNFINADKRSSLINELSDNEKSLVNELFQRIEEQRRELEQRNNTLAAIQRNFESLSLLCKGEKANNAELAKKVAGLTENNQDLIEKFAGVQRERDALQRKLEEKCEDLEKAKGKMHVLNDSLKKIEELKGKIQELEQEKKLVCNKNKEFAEENTKLGDSLRVAEAKLQGIHSEMQLKGCEMQEKTQIIESLKEENRELQANNEKIQGICDNYSENLRKMDRELMNLKEKCRKFEEKEAFFIQSKLNGEEVFRRENERLRMIINEKEENLIKLKEKLLALQTENDNLRNKLQEKSLIIQEIHENLSKKQKENEDLSKSIDNLRLEKSTLSGENLDKLKNLNNLIEEQRKTKENFEDLKLKFSEIVNLKNAVSLELKEKSADLANLKETFENSRKESEKMLKNLKEKENLLKKQSEELSKENDRFSQEKDKHKQELEEISHKNEELTSNFTSLREENSKLFQEISRLNLEKQELSSLLISEKSDFLEKKNLYLQEYKATLKEKDFLINELVKEKELLKQEKDQILKEKERFFKENQALLQDFETKSFILTKENKNLKKQLQDSEELVARLNPEGLERLKKSIESRELAFKNVIAKLENAEVFHIF